MRNYLGKDAFSICGTPNGAGGAGAKPAAFRYCVNSEAIAKKAGAMLGDEAVDITSPLLGEWPIFMATAHVSAGQWLITNDWQLAHQAADQWHSEPQVTASVQELLPGDYAQLRKHGNAWELSVTPRTSTLQPSSTIDSLAEAISVVDESLSQAVRLIADTGHPVMLLLSGGVDSGLLCALLGAYGANVTAVSIKTPWGNELEGARRTADSAKVPLVVLELSEQEIIDGIEDTLRWLQHDDAETVLIQLLVTIAHRYASEHSMDLVTGMGSDLLNAITETGMDSSSNQSISDRIASASATGLFQTNALGCMNGKKIHHPYWQAATITSQLAVAEKLKSGDGYEKYYLRKLASRRLPYETAFSIKTAIQQGSNLKYGLTQALAPASLDDYVAAAWKRLTTPVVGVNDRDQRSAKC